MPSDLSLFDDCGDDWTLLVIGSVGGVVVAAAAAVIVDCELAVVDVVIDDVDLNEAGQGMRCLFHLLHRNC